MSESIQETNYPSDLSSLLGTLLSSPDTLSKMSNIISNLTSNANSNNSPPNENNSLDKEESESNSKDNTQNIENLSPTFQNSGTENILSKMPEILSKITSTKAENSLATKQQIALLLAIRPYLSDHRKELIDTFIKMNQLGSIFKSLT